MTTFNAGRYLAPQIQSILRQLDAQDELIICDDGSEDTTTSRLAEYADPRVRIFMNRFRHVTRNFDFALHQARGRFIFLSDQDDEWYPNKLERMINALDRYDLVVSDCEVVDEAGALIAPSYFALNHSRLGMGANLWRNSYLGCCMAFRSRLLDCALPIPRDVPHDMWIGLVCEMVGTPGLLPERLMRFRRHSATSSYAGRRSRRSLYAKLASRVSVATRLAGRYLRCRSALGSTSRGT
jgi:glycosyltransferase involved in cell wall biosynthesis